MNKHNVKISVIEDLFHFKLGLMVNTIYQLSIDSYHANIISYCGIVLQNYDIKMNDSE